MGIEHVDAGWTDSSGQLLIEYENGIRLYYRPDERSEEEYLAAWEQAISETDARCGGGTRL